MDPSRPPSREAIEQVVRRILVERLGAPGAVPAPPPPGISALPAPRPGIAPAPSASGAVAPADSDPVHDLVNVALVEAASAAGRGLRIRPGAIVTPLARDEADKRHVVLTVVAPAPGAGRADGVSSGPPSSVRASQLAPAKPPANPRQIALGADHGGFALKRELAAHLGSLGYAVLDLGTHGEDPVDYPDIAHAVAKAVASGDACKGIVLDGAGIGSAIAANKVPGIRCAQARDLFEIRNSREHNDANMLSLGGRILGIDLAKAMVALWLETPFAGGRHARRVAKITQVEDAYRR